MEAGVGGQRAIDRLAALRGERHLLDAAGALDRAGIANVVLKGAVTASRYYGPQEPRRCADIDVLVDPARWRAATDVLVGLGYRRHHVDGHAETWVHEDRTPIDLHRTLPFVTLTAPAVWRRLSAHTEWVPIDAAGVIGLDRPAHYVHLGIHLAQCDLRTDSKAGRDFRRATAALTAAELDEAWMVARALGVEDVVGAARSAAAGDRGARPLPTRKLYPGHVLEFLRSPVSRDQRRREAQRAVRAFWSAEATARWLAARGREVPPGRLGRTAVRLERALSAFVRELGAAWR